MAYVGAAGSALCGGFAALQAPAAAAYGYLNDDQYYKNLAVVRVAARQWERWPHSWG
ncbi:exported hypothetical protein [Xanthomonas citri pv. fuscans]|uniref:Uncharacterized protein n=1 Tax=Xanthomonas campestris pv. phaseoli TaxID=317013 RepID=A0A7Z7J1P2_XANCH|nr:exported hypothetical protein [Xanthomonas citri pv. fuscans]SOO25675.1 exported hypothetical protein [Xanthomonas phaseoli pv. phaseoli]